VTWRAHGGREPINRTIPRASDSSLSRASTRGDVHTGFFHFSMSLARIRSCVVSPPSNWRGKDGRLTVWGKPLPDGRGSATVALILRGLLSRDRQGAVSFHQKRLTPGKHQLAAGWRHIAEFHPQRFCFVIPQVRGAIALSIAQIASRPLTAQAPLFLQRRDPAFALGSAPPAMGVGLGQGSASSVRHRSAYPGTRNTSAAWRGPR
jgi:hypothetical protein